jgi:hypothetical protein
MDVLLCENCGGEDYALSSVLDSSAQKQSAQVLLDGAGADLEVGSDFLIAAAFDQQIEYLLIATGNFDLGQIQH